MDGPRSSLKEAQKIMKNLEGAEQRRADSISAMWWAIEFSNLGQSRRSEKFLEISDRFYRHYLNDKAIFKMSAMVSALSETLSPHPVLRMQTQNGSGCAE